MRRVLKSIDDPAVLPYRFVVLDRVNHFRPAEIVPCDLNCDGVIEESFQVQIQADVRDSKSAILLRSFIGRGIPDRQINIPGRIPSTDEPWAHDFDGDDIPEIATTYWAADTVWLAIYPQSGPEIYRRAISTGIDRDSEPGWIADGSIVALHDFNGDGIDELLVRTDVRRDLYPRKLTCLDWGRDSVLWEFAVAGRITRDETYVIGGSDQSTTRVVFGVRSKGNAAVQGGMDDRHSYLICLDGHGDHRWTRVTGGIFTFGLAELIQYDPDKRPEILVQVTETIAGGTAGDSATSRLVVYDLDGEERDSYQMASGVSIARLDIHPFQEDGIPHVFASLSNNTLLVLTQQLEEVARLDYTAQILVSHCRDYLGRGTPQYLAITGDNKLWLLSGDFEPIARFDHAVMPHHFHVFPPADTTMPLALVLNANAHRDNFVLGLATTPWFTVFYRHPILAFVAAFLPLSVIIALIYFILMRFRQKNRIIGRQRDELRTALSDLRDAQERLIAAEKSQQARDIAGGVAHEIRNALYPAIASLDSLSQISRRSGLAHDQRLGQWVGLSQRAVKRAIGMIDLVRQYSKLELEKSAEQVDLRDLLEEIRESHAERLGKSRISWICMIGHSLSLKCRRAHAFSLLNNLVTNALDAVDGAERREVKVEAAPADKGVRIVVSDTGVGIPEADRERVFNAFYSTKPQTGTGLGLAMVRRIVELYGGTISVTSAEPHGSSFTVVMPNGGTGALTEELQTHDDLGHDSNR